MRTKARTPLAGDNMCPGMDNNFNGNAACDSTNASTPCPTATCPRNCRLSHRGGESFYPYEGLGVSWMVYQKNQETLRYNGQALAQSPITTNNLTITIIWDSLNGLTYEGTVCFQSSQHTIAQRQPGILNPFFPITQAPASASKTGRMPPR
jgi:hypothetical protein